MTNTYTISAFSRYVKLCPEDADPHTKYDLTRTCIEEVALKFLPKNITQERHLAVKILSKKPVKILSKKPVKTSKKTPLTTINKRDIVNTRGRFQTAYDIATAEILQHKTSDIRWSPASMQFMKVRETINKITERKGIPTVQVKGKTLEKRKKRTDELL